jgi:hypothetical protein
VAAHLVIISPRTADPLPDSANVNIMIAQNERKALFGSFYFRSTI